MTTKQDECWKRLNTKYDTEKQDRRAEMKERRCKINWVPLEEASDPTGYSERSKAMERTEGL